MARPAPKSVRGRLQEIRVDLGMFDNGLLCVVGPYEDLPRYVAWKHESPGSASARWANEPKGCYVHRTGYRPVIWIPRKPRTPDEYGTLAHEALHAVRWLMQDWADIDFDHDTQEVYCHALSHCVREVLSAL
jgi:hypothetical protein